jgi:hypothetical protein
MRHRERRCLCQAFEQDRRDHTRQEADIVLIRTNEIDLYPPNNAIGTAVAATDSRNVDTVITGGRVRKLRGKIIGLEWETFLRMVDESGSYLF